MPDHPIRPSCCREAHSVSLSLLAGSWQVRDQTTVVLGGELGRMYPGWLARYCLLHAHVAPTAAPTAPPTRDPVTAGGRRLRQAEEVSNPTSQMQHSLNPRSVPA